MRADDVTEAADESPAGPVRGTKSRRGQPFDVALGARVRALRIAADMSQAALGQAIGVSFQQVQKYEAGSDRVAVGTLKAIADALAVHPAVFFDVDMPVPTGSSSDTKAAVKAVAVLQRIHDPRVLKRLLALAEALCGDGEAPSPRPSE